MLSWNLNLEKKNWFDDMFWILNTWNRDSSNFLKYSYSSFTSEMKKQDFESQRLSDFESSKRSQEKKLQGYSYTSPASEQQRDLKVKRSKWKRKTASEPVRERERERPNGITAALWQRCRWVTWWIKWLSDPCQNWALASARPVAPATLPCHSRCISVIRTLIHKDNEAEWLMRTAFWSTAT